MRGYRPSLTFSILASLACLLILTWVLFSLFAYKSAERDLYAQKSDHAQMLLATFVNQLPELLPTFPEGMLGPDAAAAQYAGKLAEDPTFVRLTLLDANGKIIYTVGREGSDLYLPFAGAGRKSGENLLVQSGSALARSMTVQRGSRTVAQAGLVLSLQDEQQRLQRSRQLFISYFALDFILLLALGASILSRIVVTPVSRLLAATERITDGLYGHRIKVSGARELALLANSFNEMSAALQQKQEEVGSHVRALESANRELQLAREEALRSEKMASVGLLAAGTAHEIGTPLASVMGYVEILAAELESNPAQSEYLRRMQESCSRIDRIVRGLLDYARPKPPAFELVDLCLLLHQTVELLLHQGCFKQCRVELSCSDTVPSLCLDPYQLQQVLINLLLNSNDAMADNGLLHVSVSAQVNGVVAGQQITTVQIAISDNGVGIAAEHLERIFDPFFTTKEPGRGTGLGLAISARIIETFGGRITVTSTPLQGSCFTILLPHTEQTCVGGAGEAG